MSVESAIRRFRFSPLCAIVLAGGFFMLSPFQVRGEAPGSGEAEEVAAPLSERELEAAEAEKLRWVGAEKIVDPQNPMLLDKRINPGVIQVDILEDADPGVSTQFDVALLSGDREAVEKLQVWKDWEYRVAFSAVTNAEIKQFYEDLMQALREEGYVFAKVSFPTRIWPTGIFLAKVDLGPLGDVTVTGNRFHSARQIVQTLGGGQVDGRFNYNRFYQDLFDLNASSDLTISTKLKPTMRDGRRVIDAELMVEDSWPIHGSLEFSNIGTRNTGDYRLRSTLQHNNLTRNNDVLTVGWLTDPQSSDLDAYSASYYLPFSHDWSFNLFGGYSESAVDEILPQFDVRGDGWFVGAQVTRKLIEDRDKRVQLSLGWLYQDVAQEQFVGGFDAGTTRVNLSMPMITLGYASRTFDRFGGRNFFSNTLLYSSASQFGASDSDEFVRGDGNFLVNRFQFARYQRLFSGEEQPGKWSLFLKVDGQLASDAVDPSMMKSVGGVNSVRGYVEHELTADDALVASVELRTPLLQNFLPGLTKDEEYLVLNPDAWQRHRLQFLLFCDYAWLHLSSSEMGNAGDNRNQEESLLSVGAGLRLGLTKYSQMRLDWGFPLERTENHREGGRGHFGIQLQF